LKEGKVGLGEDDRVVWVGAVEFDEVHDVAKAEAWMAAEDDAGLEWEGS
jgi:hypothetical protein